MKFPKHIILDVNKKYIDNSSQYWAINYINTFDQQGPDFNELFFYKKFFLKKESLMLNKITKNQKKFTIKYSLSNKSVFLTSAQRKFYKAFFTTRIKVKKPMLLSKHVGKDVYDYLYKSSSIFDIKNLKRLLKGFKPSPITPVFRTDTLRKLFDIHFIKKEKIYTKLKYSRVPQYDIVSGGVAAFAAAFIGFLITEKFGFELLDSGDFYYLFMYGVFVSFFIKLLLKLINNYVLDWNVFSYK